MFAVHDGEELFTMPGWLGQHREQLQTLAQENRLAAQLIASLATTPAAVSIAIGAVAAAVLVVTAGAARRPQGRGWTVAYAAVLGVLFLHVFTHIGQAILFRDYVPGLYGAVGAVLPGGAYPYYRLTRAGWLTWKTAILSATVGVVAAGPLVIAAHSLGRALTHN